MDLTILLAQTADTMSATYDWVISRGLLGGALVAVAAMAAVIRRLYADNQHLRDQREADLKAQKDEVKALAQDTTTKVEGMLAKQVDLVERVVQTQAETNAAIRSLSRA